MQTHSPSVEPWAREAAKWPREDCPTGGSQSWKSCSQSRDRRMSRKHQCPLPECWRQCSSSSPSPSRSGPPSEQLCLHIWDLKLQARIQESRSRAWQTPTWLKKTPRRQVKFNLNEELGGEPTLPTGVTLFLSGGEGVEQYTTLTLWPDHEEGPQWSSIPTRGVRPKVQLSAIWSPLRPEGPDPVSHHHRWIQAEMLKIPHIPWWKTLMPSGKITMFSHILCENLNKPKALCLACWQAAAFWLPWAQQETAGWWDPPPAIPRLHLEDYMPYPASSYFWIMGQQMTTALARSLQACAEKSGFPTGVLCDVAWELQWCMALLLVLNSNEIVKASFLRPIEGECGTTPTPEEEATLLGNI